MKNFIALIVAGVLVFPLSGCLKEKTAVPVTVQKQRVTVADAVMQSYVERYDFPAHVDAVDAVTVKTRVAGFLKNRMFEEGDIVKKGQALFQIEDEPFKAKVAQAAADLAKAEADAKNASLSLARALELRRTGNISQATIDAREAENSMAAAQVLQAKATLNLAKIDLGYTTITAPFTGKIGLADFSNGEFLSAGTTLAQMVSIDPMYVLFSVNENELLEMQSAGVFENGGDDLAVSLKMADDSVYAYGGTLNFMDVTVDAGTDTLKMRASFPNPQKHLVAGQYVTVVLEYEAPEKKIVIPQKALMSSTAAKFVYVVDAAGNVVNKPVTVGPVQGKDIVIMTGLNAGDRVIVEGIQKVRPGMAVIAAKEGAKAAPAQQQNKTPQK